MTDEHEHDGDETAPGATEGTGEDFPTESSVGTTPAVRDTDEVAETPETDAGTTAAPATPTPDAAAGEQLGLDAIATDAAPRPTPGGPRAPRPKSRRKSKRAPIPRSGRVWRRPLRPSSVSTT